MFMYHIQKKIIQEKSHLFTKKCDWLYIAEWMIKNKKRSAPKIAKGLKIPPPPNNENKQKMLKS